MGTTAAAEELGTTTAEKATFKNQFFLKKATFKNPLLLPGGQKIRTSIFTAGGDVTLAVWSGPACPELHPILPGQTQGSQHPFCCTLSSAVSFLAGKQAQP